MLTPVGIIGTQLEEQAELLFTGHSFSHAHPHNQILFFQPHSIKATNFFSPPCWVRAETPSSFPATLRGGDHIGDASHMQQDTTLPTCLQSTLIVYFHLSKTSARLGLKKGWEGGKPSESWAACWSPKGLKLGMGGGASSPFQRSFQ